MIRSLKLVLLFLPFLISCQDEIVVVDGYTDQLTYHPGNEVKLYLNVKEARKGKIRLFNANKKVMHTFKADLKVQVGNVNSSNGSLDYSHAVSTILPDLPNGLYLWEGIIPIVIEKEKAKKIAVLVPFYTWNAYSTSGGANMYLGKDKRSETRLRRASFQRYIPMDQYGKVFYPWMIKQTFQKQTVYITDRTLSREGIPNETELLIIPGHSEYWSTEMRANVAAFNARGGRILVLSGNNCWFKVRDENNELICYKTDSDPIELESERTSLYHRSPHSQSTLGLLGAGFEFGGYGMRGEVNPGNYIVFNANSPVFEGTKLCYGDTLHLASQEVDGVPLMLDGLMPNPIIDREKIPFEKAELLAWTPAYRDGQKVGTMMAVQKTKSHGKIINVATTDWCSKRGMGGPSSDQLKLITENMIDILLEDRVLFLK